MFKHWDFHHGDVIVYNNLFGEQNQVTVDYIYKNGIKSWVIVCLENDDSSVRANAKHEFNISRVEKIISRGTGPKAIRKQPKISPSAFRKGAIVEYNVFPTSEGPQTIDVDHIRSNGADSWLIVSSEDDTGCLAGHKRAINITHMTRILQQGNGPVDIRWNAAEAAIDKYKECNYSFVAGVVDKHHSQYLISDIRRLIVAVSYDIIDHTTYVDYDKLTRMVFKHGCIKLKTYLYECEPVYICNKKKFKRLVKQLLPKCLFKKKVVVLEEQRMYDELYNDEFDCAPEMNDDRIEAEQKEKGSHYDIIFDNPDFGYR